MTAILYPSIGGEPWMFKLVDKDVVTEGSTDNEESESIGVVVAGGDKEYTPLNISEGIEDTHEGIILSIGDMSKDGKLEVYMELDFPLSTSPHKTLLSYMKSSYPPSYFKTFHFFLEDGQGNKRKYAIKNTDMGSFNVRYTEINVEDEDFNSAYISRVGFNIENPKKDIEDNFKFFLSELSLSKLNKPTYCKPEEVIRFLGLLDNHGRPLILSQESKPSYEDVCNHILEAEAFIDAQTRTSFKINRIENEIRDERLSITMPYGGFHGIYRGSAMPMMYGGQMFEGVPVSLVKQNIQPIDYSLGDKVEVRRLGTLWETLPESRLWWDAQKGIIWVKDYFHRPDSSIRVTYRWGEDKVPADIAKCCKLQASKQIVATDWYRASFPISPEDFSPLKADTMNSWTWEIKDIIRGYQTQISVGAL